MSNQTISGIREQFIQSANNSKILSKKCLECQHVMLETILYCEKCNNNRFELVEYNGIGTVNTFTIHSVPPEGFDDVQSYAWVVFTLDDISFRVSGFLPGVQKPGDLPLGSKVQVIGFDEKHGLTLKKI